MPIDGRGPRRLTEFDGLNPAGLRVHPDGRRLLFGASLAGQPEPRPTGLDTFFEGFGGSSLAEIATEYR